MHVRVISDTESIALQQDENETDITPIIAPTTPTIHSNTELSIICDDSSHSTDPEEDEAEPIKEKKGYYQATTSYSELQNASMLIHSPQSSSYSLQANESIVDIRESCADEMYNEQSEGWPVFEPLDGPYSWSVYKTDYKQLWNEVLSGIVVSFAQVPEAVAFSFLAGVDPFIGLHAAWIVGFITSLCGGRCAEISGATGATAAVLAPYIADPNVGVMYLPYMIALVGIIIMIWGFIGVSKMVSLVPHSCMIGFVNGLAVIIAYAQNNAFEALSIKHPQRDSEFYIELITMIAITISTFCIVEFLPKVTKVIPATLVALSLAMFVEHIIIRMICGMETVLIGELGDFAGGLPKIPGIDPYWDLPPLNMDTFSIILLPSLTVALVSTVEDLLTIEIVHDLTNTRPRSVAKCELIAKTQIIAMGFANFVCGLLGAIGGGSTIGLSTVNCYSANGRYRWSGLACAISTFFIVFVASPVLINIPAAALVGLMLVVVLHTFEWSSIPILIVTFLPLTVRNYLNDRIFGDRWNVHRKIRRADGVIILIVTILTIVSNLGYAIIAGVVFAALMYAWDSAKEFKYDCITIKRPVAKSKDKYEIVKIYTLEGPLLFSNANQLPSIFNWNCDPQMVEVHLQNCIVYDFTALNALNNIAEKYNAKQKKIHLKYINIRAKKSFEKANQLIAHFTYDMNVSVDDDKNFTAATYLNVTGATQRKRGKSRQI